MTCKGQAFLTKIHFASINPSEDKYSKQCDALAATAINLVERAAEHGVTTAWQCLVQTDFQDRTVQITDQGSLCLTHHQQLNGDGVWQAHPQKPATIDPNPQWIDRLVRDVAYVRMGLTP